MREITDEHLARGVQQGRVDDLAVLVERHYDGLTGYLYRFCGGDRPLAEDLVQDTFFQVLRAIGQYRYPRPFKPWLYAVATNLARNHYQRADTRRTQAYVVAAEEAGPGVEDAVVVAEEAQCLSRLLLALPVHQREVVLLRYSEEMSLSEIAQVLEIPVGTVKSRLSLGLARLRTLSEQRDDPETS